MVDQYLRERVQAEAKHYFESYTQTDLEALLAQAWSQAEGQALPVRTQDNRGVRIARRLMQNLAGHSEVVSVTAGMVVVKVIDHLVQSGIDVTAFEAPAAIISALIVKSVLHEWKDDENNINVDGSD